MTLYGVFVGVLVTGVLGIATTATFPVPDPYSSAGYQTISLRRMLMSLGTSLVVLTAGLFMPARIAFLRLGLMLAAVANLVVGNVWAWDYDNDWIRLLAAVASLVVAVGAGLVQYARRPGMSPPTDHPASAADSGLAAPEAMEARLRVIEQRLDAAATALSRAPDHVTAPSNLS